MQRIKKFGIMSVGKIYAIISAIFGLLDGLSIAFFGPAIEQFAANYQLAGEVSFFTQLGILAIIVLPIVYAIIGFILAAIGAWIYNLIAGKIGGIEIELE